MRFEGDNCVYWGSKGCLFLPECMFQGEKKIVPETGVGSVHGQSYVEAEGVFKALPAFCMYDLHNPSLLLNCFASQADF